MAGIVINGTDSDGVVLSNPATDDPATVTATGYVTNPTQSYNYTAVYGAPGYSWTVANLGTIDGVGPYMNDQPSNTGGYASNQGFFFEWYAGIGVHLTAGGVVTNGQSGSSSGLIRGGGAGVYIEGGSGNVTNFGTIESLEDTIGLSVAVLLQAGGSVENFGTISGPRGIKFSGTLPGTVTNAGTINGAVQFGDGDDRLIVDPGAVFVGTVDGGGGSDVLELAAGTGNTTLSGLGTKFINFETVVFDPNAGCMVTLADPAAFTGTIAGFSAGDTLDLIGRAATGVTYAGGVLTVQNGGTVVAALNLAGSYTTADFSIGSDGHGGTDIGIAAALPPGSPTAINGSVTTAENHAVSGSVTSTGDTDNDVAYVVDVGPAHGALTSFNAASGAFTYTPATNYFGSDSFQFHAVDDPVSSNQATESITVGALPPTGISLAADSAALAAIQVEGSSSGLRSGTAIATFTETGGISGDAYSFTLSGANGFSMSSADNIGTLSTGGTIVSGSTNGRVYALTVTANDTTNSTHSAALPFDLVVGNGQSSSNGNDTIKLDTGSGNLGISAITPTIVYGLNGGDKIDATGMTASVWFVGGPGADTMTGGSGVDTYLYAATSESKPGSGNFDKISNFQPSGSNHDLIDFGSIVGLPNIDAAHTSAVQGLIGNGVQVLAGHVAWSTTGISGQTIVYGNTSTHSENQGSTDMEIHLIGTLTLNSADFHHV
jgi:Bacterial Ig domain